MLKKIKETPSLTKYVVFSLAVLIIYYAIEFIVSAKTGVERSTLTTCITGVLGGEVLSCALIKVFKLKEEDKPIPTTMMSDLLTEDEINDLLKEENKG